MVHQTSGPVEWRTERPLRSPIASIAQFLGGRLAYTCEVADFVPGEPLVQATADGLLPIETTYTWETGGDERIRMTLRNRGAPSGFVRWIAPFTTLAMRRANRMIPRG